MISQVHERREHIISQCGQLVCIAGGRVMTEGPGAGPKIADSIPMARNTKNEAMNVRANGTVTMRSVLVTTQSNQIDIRMTSSL